MERALAHLDVGDCPRVALMTRTAKSTARPVIGADPASMRVIVFESGLPVWVETARLAAAGPFDLMVDATQSRQDQVNRFYRNFQHLREGGIYLVPAFGRAGSVPAWDGLQKYVAVLGAEGQGRAQRLVRFAAAIGDVWESNGALAVARKGHSLAMMREREMTEALRVNPTRGRTLTELPAVEFASRCEVTRSPYYQGGFEVSDSFTVPALYLREYHELVCAPRGLVVQDNLLTPDTFRHHLDRGLKHRRLLPVGRGFATPDADLRTPTKPLEGTYFHLDNEHQGHFGHALTEQVSRLWALDEAKRRYPDLKVLIGTKKVRNRSLPGWQSTLLASAGIQPDDVALIGGPRRVERLVAATPMFSMPAYAHPSLSQIWDEVGARLRELAPVRNYPRRCFVTRAHEKRSCRNRLEVEELFASHGFEIVHPERHSLPEQVAMFDHAEVIGGFSGSGLFNAIFARSPKHLVIVGPTSYRSSNEYLISSVRGHRISLALCRSEIDQPPTGASGDAFNSSFTCDMMREGRWLTNVLEAL